MNEEHTIDPAGLTIVKSDEGYELQASRTLALPDGSPLVHPRRKLIEHIVDEFSGFGIIKIDEEGRVISPQVISSYILLGVQREIEHTPEDQFVSEFGKWVLLDPCLMRCAGPEAVNQMAQWSPLLDFFAARNLNPPAFSQGGVDLEDSDNATSLLIKCVTSICGEDDTALNELKERGYSFIAGMEAEFQKLGPEEWSVMKFLFGGHNAVLYPLLLVLGKCSPQEYANGLMAAHCLLTTAFGDVDTDEHIEQTRVFREDAQVAHAFLESARSPWLKEIDKGEGAQREFKSTLRTEVATGKKNKALEHAVLKNIAGFMNCKGGVVFVGVTDDGDISGIELDTFDNNDHWSLHLNNKIGFHIGKRFLPYHSTEFEVLHGKTVARIQVEQSKEPVFLNEEKLKPDGEKRAFFIRGGPAAEKLSPTETEKYLKNHFPDHRE